MQLEQTDKPKITLQWSARQKNTDIAISGYSITYAGAQRREEDDDDPPICCLTNSLTESAQNGICRWSLQINKMRYGMCVGIGQIQQAQSHNFKQWGWGSTGHGHYCLISNGTLFSHSDYQLNWRMKDFVYEVGNILHFEYKDGMLKVWNDQKITEMLMQMGNGQNYALCAYLWDEGDSIELINQ